LVFLTTEAGGIIVTIRFATPDDAGQVLEIYAPFCHTPVSFEEEPPDLAEMRQRIAKTVAEFPWLVCEDATRVLGYAYAGPHRQRAAYRWSVEVSAYVREGKRGSGIGRSLYTSLFRVLVLQGFYNAYAGITLPNPASVGFHEALGFAPVGIYRRVGFKCGAWHDVGWWQRTLQEHSVAPVAPIELPRVRASPELELAVRSKPGPVNLTHQ
jgi:phosphinothricin acetyltransferase